MPIMSPTSVLVYCGLSIVDWAHENSNTRERSSNSRVFEFSYATPPNA